jgi:Ca2+-binding EF-hand superfamily protein
LLVALLLTLTLTSPHPPTSKRTFATFDEDGGGSVDAAELDVAFKKMNAPGVASMSWEALGELIAEVDEDGNGEIDFVEFLAMMDRVRHGGADGLPSLSSGLLAVGAAARSLARDLLL